MPFLRDDALFDEKVSWASPFLSGLNEFGDWSSIYSSPWSQLKTCGIEKFGDETWKCDGLLSSSKMWTVLQCRIITTFDCCAQQTMRKVGEHREQYYILGVSMNT